MTSVARLTELFTPEHYDINLTLDESAHTFSGTVTLSGDSINSAKAVKLHAKDLTITSATVDDQVAEFSTGDNDELSIVINNLTDDKHTIVVKFNGEITDQMHGLYPCYYEHEGVKKKLFATQFESHHAREVFPCIDEPAAKATFALELTTASDQSVLSNMPIKEQSTVDGQLVTLFDTTPRMSTYLLAFVTGELQKTTAKTKGGVEVNIWSTLAQPTTSLGFALDIAVRSIEFYDDYFGTAYPLPKSDHVALPDFSSGAMENWGLITYRESTLLVDPTMTSIDTKHYVATVIAHELAHQWFGNLVTMDWWNDLWLNESFATLMEYICIDTLHPEWDIWLDFVTSESVAALRRDSIDGVQAVQVDVNHPDEIGTLFDGAIVYAKGARLLHMIQQYVGSDDFRTGLKAYFAEFAYKNTVGNDLWDALEKSSGKQVKSIMNTWISQSGFPVVTIDRNGEEVSLSQKQFFVGPHKPSDKLWPIPLNSDDNGAPKLMENATISYISDKPIQLNLGDSAHFITHYDDLSLSALLTRVESGELDPIGREQLLNEATLLARGGVSSSETLLPLVMAYRNEKLEQVWSAVSLGLAELRKFVENDEVAEKKLRTLSAELARPEYDRLGWDNIDGEPENDIKLRSTMIALSLYGEVPDALAKAKQLFETVPLEELDPELRALVIGSVARHGDSTIVDKLMETYQSTQSPDLRIDICVGVTSTRDHAKISQLLDNMKDSKIIRPQDVFRWFVYLIRGRESRELSWQWVQDNWSWVEETFSGDKSYDDFPRYSANGLVTREQLEQYKTFFEPMANNPALTRTITMGISEIEGRVELIEKDEPAVVAALKAL